MASDTGQCSPQLVMVRRDISGIETELLPKGIKIRTFAEGDAVHWDRIISESFAFDRPDGHFERIMRPDPSFKPERIFFACIDDGTGPTPAATASAWHKPTLGDDVGYLHYVGTRPASTGRGLARHVSIACLIQMQKEGRTSAVLQTDDFRLAAIKLYRRLHFDPVIVHASHRERWQATLSAIGEPQSAKTPLTLDDLPHLKPLAAT